ncbi:protein-tyrosine phosphatase-like protein [Blastocladiella britannica]|nr:protein-tyrosine phosphatase-like protein [Blastocladiella britannica]
MAPSTDNTPTLVDCSPLQKECMDQLGSPSLDSNSVPPPPAAAVRTSHSHPINVSWLIPHHALVAPPSAGFDLDAFTSTLTSTTPIGGRPQLGNIGLSSCPGKQVRLDAASAQAAMAGAGRQPVRRDLAVDLPRVAEMGVKLIVCCLYDEELAYLGAPWDRYSSIANSLGIQVSRVPMIDGSVPMEQAPLESALVAIHQQLAAGQHVLIHCRGGIGRAALVACCYFLKHGWSGDDRAAIAHVRRMRSPRAIETVQQESYLYQYWQQQRQASPAGDGNANAANR